MTTRPAPAGATSLRFAPGVTLTGLPFGGAVLVHGTTLALAEFDESDAALIDHLMRHGLAGAPRDPRELVRALATGGWLPRTAPGTGGPATDERATEDPSPQGG